MATSKRLPDRAPSRAPPAAAAAAAAPAAPSAAPAEKPPRALPPPGRPARTEDELLAELGASPRPSGLAATVRAAAKPSGPAAAAPVRPEPAGQKAKASDPLLDSVSDEELARELAPQAPAQQRSVYVPPAPGSELPERLSPEQVNQAVAARTPELKQCIAEQRAAEPNLKGTLRLRLVIGGDGAVREASPASEDLAKKPIARCVTGIVKETRFPRSRASLQEVVFPLKF